MNLLKQVITVVIVNTILCTLMPAQAQVIISEFMAINSSGIEDEDGDRSDWIELYNNSNDSINLGGWHLTDKSTDLTKWSISPVVLQPGESYVIWASNKNRKDPDEELHTNFKLSGGGEYLALVKPDGTTVVSEFSPSYPAQVDDVSFGYRMAQSTNIVLSANAPCRAFVPSDDSLGLTWTEEVFDDSSWLAGTTGIGYENNTGYESLINLDVQSIMYNVNASIYTRIPFVVPSGLSIESALFRIRYDDGFRAYFNGDPSITANISGTYSWNEDANGYLESTDYVDFPLSSIGSQLHSGTNILAIHGVNDVQGSSDFLVLPELTLYSTSIATNLAPQYFATPTPSVSNVGGADNIGPQYSMEGHYPLQPLETEDLNVSVKVVDEADGVSSITMTYEIMFTGETTIPMYDDGLHGDGLAGDDIYGATIPASAFSAGEMIRYRFNAMDGASYSSRWPLFYDPLNSPEFFGTVAQVGVTSSMPVYHWFIENIGQADTRNESRSSIFYNGVLYDNIMTRTRGRSTMEPDIFKKSHKFDFNRGHHFEYDTEERKIEEMNLNTTFGDKTYLRRMLSWNSYQATGQPGCQSFLVHLRQNNQFFGIQNFEEQVDEDFLQRHGFDPNGALYKMQGTTSDVDSAYKRTRLEDTDRSDIESLISGLKGSNSESYIFDNLDVANFLNYLVLSSIIRDGDNAAKNHYYYRDSDGSGDWSIFGWDKDLTFGMSWTSSDHILHDDLSPGGALLYPPWSYLVSAFDDSPDLKEMFMRRLRTVAEQLFGLAPGGHYNTLISQLLTTHDTDLLLDYNKWGPWTFGNDGNLTPQQANQQQTIDFYLDGIGTQWGGRRDIIFNNSALPDAQPASPAIEISAIKAIPSSGNQSEEYVELYNPNSYAVDISGWSLSNAVTHVFRPGSVILPYKKFYVSPDTGSFRNRSISPKGGENLFVQGPYKGMLSSRGETLALHDANGLLKDTETWIEDLSDAQRWLRITEVMYNPALPNGANYTEDHLEFIELQNTGTSPLNIGGTFFTQGLIYTNPAITLPAGGYLVVASDPVEFANQYDTNSMTVVGPFSGYLSNGNDDIELEDDRGETIQRFEYNDDWYPNTDGNGFSLTLINPAETNFATWNTKAAWRSSLDLGGSPGASDNDLLPNTLIINEVLAHSDIGNDWVEIKNMTNAAVDLSYWFLSDDWNDLKKYQLPSGSVLPANGFLVLHEADFNSGPSAFALSELGDEAILSKALSDGTLQGYQVAREFNASGKDIAFGQWTDSEGDHQFIPMAAQTPGAENSAPKTGPVIISEIMYSPETNKAEYVELYNSSGSTISLYDVNYPTNRWSLSDAINYTFASGITLDAGESLIICSTNPIVFRTQYSVPVEVDVYGPFNGALNNAGERLRLYYPGNPEPTFVPQIQIESVNYKPVVPWPVLTLGKSIERISITSPANDPASWNISATNGTPGTTGFVNLPAIDLYLNSWKEQYFGNPPGAGSGDSDDPDFDGENNYDEFIAGTNPTNTADFSSLNITVLLNGNVQVSIYARATDSGISQGLERYYTLLQKTNLTDSAWSDVIGATDVLATNQTLSTEQIPANDATFSAKIEVK